MGPPPPSDEVKIGELLKKSIDNGIYVEAFLSAD